VHRLISLGLQTATHNISDYLNDLDTVKPVLAVTFIKQPTCLKQPYRMFPNFNFVLIFTSVKQPPALSKLSSCWLIHDQALRTVPGKKVLGDGREIKNGGTTNTILSFFMVQSIWIFQETLPTHLILIDFSSTPPPWCPFSWNSPKSGSVVPYSWLMWGCSQLLQCSKASAGELTTLVSGPCMFCLAVALNLLLIIQSFSFK